MRIRWRLPPKRKKKKKLPQNKPSRDESSLPRCNISSMVGSAAHGCFVNCHGLRRKKQQKTRTTYNHNQKVRIALLMNCVKAAMFLRTMLYINVVILNL